MTDNYIDYRELGVDPDEYKKKRVVVELTEEIVSRFDSYEDYYKFLATLDKKVTKTLGRMDDAIPKLDSAMYFDTVCYLLENRPTPQEAFAYTAELYNKDDEWMKVAKNTKLRAYVHRDITSELLSTEIKTVERIVDNELDLKTAMVTSKTPNQSVRRIHKLIKVSDRLDSLEKRVGNIEKRQDVAEYLIKAVVDMSCRDALKTEAQRLIKEGKLTRKEISSITGISIRALTNYAKELKEGE